MDNLLKKAADLIIKSDYCIAFTGAGISVESGIPPFRGSTGIWSRYNPEILGIDFFLSNPEKSWPVIKEIFYDFFGSAKPNNAHFALAKMEDSGYLKSVITQNIDNLHQDAGSKKVIEFHGNSKQLVCVGCGKTSSVGKVNWSKVPLKCTECYKLLKPDFVFFGEGIPENAYRNSLNEALNADVCIIVGSTGEVMPAAMVPYEAKRNGAFIIEVNPDESLFTNNLTDLHLKGDAVYIFNKLGKLLFN